MSFTSAQLPSSPAVRVLIENGTYGLRNLGDILMLQVLAERIRDHAGEANIRIVTDSPERLRFFMPESHAVRPGDWNTTFERRRLVRTIKRSVNSFSHQMLRSVWRPTFADAPASAATGVKKALAIYQNHTPSSVKFFEEIAAADAVVASGGGYLNDHFVSQAMRILQTLECAQQLHKPTALFGQGLGPMTNLTLIGLATKVLPRATMIAVRDEGTSLPLLLKLGVPRKRIRFTGDDALEPAFLTRPREIGPAIGFNLRIAPYSSVDSRLAQEIAAVVRELAERLHAPLLPLPISISPTDGDLVHFRNALNLSSTDVPDISPMTQPTHTMQLVSQCRLVITGSYHAAVFALAMGIPTIGVAATAYYTEKLQGLADQFPALAIVESPATLLQKRRLQQLAESLLATRHTSSPEELSSPVAQIEAGRDAANQFLARAANICSNNIL